MSSNMNNGNQGDAQTTGSNIVVANTRGTNSASGRQAPEPDFHGELSDVAFLAMDKLAANAAIIRYHSIRPGRRADRFTLDPATLSNEEIASIFDPTLVLRYQKRVCTRRLAGVVVHSKLEIQLRRLLAGSQDLEQQLQDGLIDDEGRVVQQSE